MPGPERFSPGVAELSDLLVPKWLIASGYVKIATENGYLDFIVSFPMKMVIFHSPVGLAEGNPSLNSA